MQRAKLLVDRLASLQCPIHEDDLVGNILDGLRGQFCKICCTFSTRNISLMIMGVLTTEEHLHKQEKSMGDDLNMPIKPTVYRETATRFKHRPPSWSQFASAATPCEQLFSPETIYSTTRK